MYSITRKKWLFHAWGNNSHAKSHTLGAAPGYCLTFKFLIWYLRLSIYNVKRLGLGARLFYHIFKIVGVGGANQFDATRLMQL